MAANTLQPARWLTALVEQIQFLIPTAVITRAFDSSSDEYLSVAFSGQTHLLRIKEETAPANGAYDGIGVAQRVYTPHVAQVGINTAAEGGGLDTDTETVRAVMYVVAAKIGARLQIFAKSGIAVTDMVDGDASLVVNIRPSVAAQSPMINL